MHKSDAAICNTSLLRFIPNVKNCTGKASFIESQRDMKDSRFVFAKLTVASNRRNSWFEGNTGERYGENDDHL